MLCVALAACFLPSCVETQGNYEEAEPLLERAFAIVIKAPGPGHRAMAAVLNSMVELGLSRVQVRAAREKQLLMPAVLWEGKGDHSDTLCRVAIYVCRVAIPEQVNSTFTDTQLSCSVAGPHLFDTIRAKQY